MRVLICGSRTWVAEQPIALLLSGLDRYTDEVIQGGAQGADDEARLWALKLQIPTVTFTADWEHHGRAAGPLRNQRMLDEGRPDVVYAYVDRPLAQSKGTADMIRRARKASIPAYVTEAV